MFCFTVVCPNLSVLQEGAGRWLFCCQRKFLIPPFEIWQGVLLSFQVL